MFAGHAGAAMAIGRAERRVNVGLFVTAALLLDIVLPLVGRSARKFGLGLWQGVPVALVVEALIGRHDNRPAASVCACHGREFIACPRRRRAGVPAGAPPRDGRSP